jgi:hypothetical protein
LHRLWKRLAAFSDLTFESADFAVQEIDLVEEFAQQQAVMRSQMARQGMA